MILLTGGARSGKSRLAVETLRDRSGEVTYVATALPSDDEMAERIEAHRRGRPASWTVIEEATDLTGALSRVHQRSAVIVDCLTLWVSNLMESRYDEEILQLSEVASRAAAERREETIVVSNEVGSGLVPTAPLGRRFRDLQGEVNQMWAQRAAHVYLVVAGRAVLLPERLSNDG